MELLTPTVTAAGCVLWGCEWLPKGSHAVLRIYIDSPAGVSVSDCQRITQQISPLLDVADVIPGAYNLEVSSPGEKRVIFTIEQLQLYQGMQIRVRLSQPWTQRKHMMGVVCAIDNEHLELQTLEQLHTIPVSLISKVQLWPETCYTC